MQFVELIKKILTNVDSLKEKNSCIRVNLPNYIYDQDNINFITCVKVILKLEGGEE